jgi:hypothetical protein
MTTRVLIMTNLFIVVSHENERRDAENTSGTFKIFLLSFGFGPKFLISTKTHVLKNVSYEHEVFSEEFTAPTFHESLTIQEQ